MTDIKSRWSDRIVFKGRDGETFRQTLIREIEERANLRGAYLRDADLSLAVPAGDSEALEDIKKCAAEEGGAQ